MRALDLNSIFIRDFLEQSFAATGHRGYRVLDLGCGTRPYRDIYDSCHLFAVTGDSDALAPSDVRLSAGALPFSDSSFDTILMTEVIEHIQVPTAALAEAARVLSPGGRFFLTWPFSYSMHELPRDYVRFTEFGMAFLLAQAGLEIELLRRRGDMLAVLATIVGQLCLGFAHLLVRLPLVGRLLLPLEWLCVATNNALVVTLHWGTRNSRRLQPTTVGDGLSGIGHLALWTLGYCLVARKRPRRIEG